MDAIEEKHMCMEFGFNLKKKFNETLNFNSTTTKTILL